MSENDRASTVLIYGTNLAGYRVAYALAKMGYKAVMLNRGAYVDQYGNQVLAQLPLDFCWACGHMPQRLFIGLGAMQVLYNADLLEVSGEPGRFKVKIRKRDHYVNNFACTECEACIRACPVEVEDNGNKRKAIYVHPEIAWENIFLIDEDHCTRCGECEKVCPTGCLKLERPEETIEMEVGAVVLAPEFDEPTREDLAKFGYGTLENVVKSADLARRSLLTNFVKNSLERPSDGKLPQRVAVVVTPQYNQGVEYESYNATISAIYRAVRTKELMPEAQVTVFFREFRGFGKGHYRWYEKALELGVEIIRAQDLQVEEGKKKGDVKIKYTLGGQDRELEAELLILIAGQKPPTLMGKLSRLTGVEADEHGFCKVLPFACGKTTKEGIFAVGEFTGPKGNPETVWEGYGTATEILEYLGDKNFAPVPPPQLRSVEGEPVKVGVFICSCFGEFNQYLDLEGLAEKVRGLPGVDHVEIIKGCCTPPTMQETAQAIKASEVNRVVLAVCTPLQKLLKYRRTVMMAGLNPLLSEFLRLREDIIRVHEDREAMKEKALALIASGVEKVKKAQAAPPPTEAFTSTVLVVGGGAAGMEAALAIANRGFPVTLVEREKELGGLARDLQVDLEGHDLSAYVAWLTERVLNHPHITVLTDAQITDMWGKAGRFEAHIRQGDETQVVRVGIVIPAVGAESFRPNGAFLYGKDERVVTQRELELSLQKGETPRGPVIMIQCVGSRNKARPYCSRVCCSQALKNALALADRGVEVAILYRDLNTYGFKEDYYRMAVEKGIRFIRFSLGDYPWVEAGGSLLKVTVHDVDRNREETLEAARVVLSVGIVPREDYQELVQALGYKLDSQGFFDTETSMCPYEEAIKRLMKPWELSSNGIFPVGLAHSPRSLVEALLTARDAAGRSLTLLGKPQLPPPNAMYVSAVRESKCVACGLCVEVCPYYAREIDEVKGVARVRPYLCDSCGACLVACPSEAAYLRDARGEQMIPSVDALLL